MSSTINQNQFIYNLLFTRIDNKKMDNRNLDEDEEFKGERIYETKGSRLRAIAHIIKKYLQIKGIQSNPKTVDDAMFPIINMVLKDLQFRKFTLDNYKAFIFYDEKSTEFSIKRITDEMLELIKEEENIDDLVSKELENKINELESGLNKKKTLTKQEMSSITNQNNMYPKPCGYNCNIQIYWNTSTNFKKYDV